MRLLITGDRDWSDYEAVLRVVEKLRPSVVIHGAARGTDTFAGVAADALCIEVESYPARWKEFGRAAGPIRNQAMLDLGQPDLVVYFHDDLERSRGTRDMVNRARRAAVQVLSFKEVLG